MRICNNKSVVVDANILQQIKNIISSGRSSRQDPQIRIMNHLVGTKAFLVCPSFIFWLLQLVNYLSPSPSHPMKLNQHTGKLYFFSGTSYTRFDLRKNRMDTGYPRIIALSNWPGVFSHSIDAACHLPNNMVCFFSGNYYILYDIKKEKTLSGYPKKIDSINWPGLSFSRFFYTLNLFSASILFKIQPWQQQYKNTD